MTDEAPPPSPEQPRRPAPANPPARVFIARHGLPPMIATPARPKNGPVSPARSVREVPASRPALRD
ncbi:hypothetical protein ABZ707_08765 [Streptomyces sp. NPDC006923]|uniref:hypothetical protein n=1 Tax=Streptomyces sp. NPDC006923 TaxID=3155355 RepID=UPI00340B0A9B